MLGSSREGRCTSTITQNTTIVETSDFRAQKADFGVIVMGKGPRDEVEDVKCRNE